MFSHISSFLNIAMAQLVKIIPKGDKDLCIPHNGKKSRR